MYKPKQTESKLLIVSGQQKDVLKPQTKSYIIGLEFEVVTFIQF